MTMNIQQALNHITKNIHLSQPQMEDVMRSIMQGEATDAQIGALMMGLRMKGESIDEITAAARIMREFAIKIDVSDIPHLVDIVGTGGDGIGTLNVSTASAFVVAGAGVPVAKHGNRAFSSKSGAADVLTALGVNIDADLDIIQQAIHKIGIGFLMAPRHHGAMRHVGGARVELGMRTIFNLLGPLSNPAMVKYMLVGTFARKWVEPMAKALAMLGVERAWVVHGSDGLDEISLSGPTTVAELKGGTVTLSEISPKDAGIQIQPLSTVKGGTPEQNAAALKAMLGGKKGAFRDFVLLNAGAALVVAGKAGSLREGAEISAVSIDSGKALAALNDLVLLTRRTDVL